MGDLAEEGARSLSQLQSLRWVSLVSGACNLALIFVSLFLLASIPPTCPARRRDILPFVAVALIALVRLAYMYGAARAQRATALSIVGVPVESDPGVIRHERRVRYKRWLWWTRFGAAITVLQFVVAFYLMVVVLKDFSFGENSAKCMMGQHKEDKDKQQLLVISFLILVWLVVIIQCFMGSDVLRWRSFYATHDTAWKAHYQEVFDHGIREAFCCMGRAKYLSVLDEDEIYSVARLLGDLVAYRASGTGHLEFLAGLALLQSQNQFPKQYNDAMEAPLAHIRDAAVFHSFAEAAYTGPLLDVGRNPVLFPCAWLYRQGILSPWSRNRRPVLEGDNWWRGHAAAFLKYVKLSPEALRRGRVCQTKREAAYFVVVIHDLRTVVISVRGTETPEDLITDGLCKECILSMDDLDGLINSHFLTPHVKESILSSPHYGHSGIVDSAREIFMQIDGQPGGKEGSPSEASGFLSSLLGPGCECQGYNLRIVGHSLGGAVATLLGLRLYRRYPNLHVYAYGPLPCVDSVISEACSNFVTSIVYNDEFSSRLSINSILRLRAAAISALSVDSSANSAMINKLIRRVLLAKRCEENGEKERTILSLQPGTVATETNTHICKRRHLKHIVKGACYICGHALSCKANTSDHQSCSCVKDDFELSPDTESEIGPLSDNTAYKFTAGSPESVQGLFRHGPHVFDDSDSDCVEDGPSGYNNFYELSDGHKTESYEIPGDFLTFRGQASSFKVHSPSRIEVSVGDFSEMFLPGLIIHIVPEERSTLPLWKSWRVNDRQQCYKAFVAQRENFMDLVVTPYMFLDHLPWRCHYALQRILESEKSQGEFTNNGYNDAHLV